MKNTKFEDLLFNGTSCRKENDNYLESQLITYIGNKRSLLDFIGTTITFVQEKLVREKLSFFDVFSGSGIVSRYFKSTASELYSNDLEDYATIINNCYLSNTNERDMIQLRSLYCQLKENLNDIELTNSWQNGIISSEYSPNNDSNIKKDERVFYTTRNAHYIDTARNLIGNMPSKIQPFFLAPLLSEASIHANTAGVFKGFYKNRETGIGKYGGKKGDAISRITGNIDLPFPVFSEYDCPIHILQGNANDIVKDVPMVDLAYLDPPYNQHPYGSNYFMLNIISNNCKPEHISKVSGIPTDWNRSAYNNKKSSFFAFADLVEKIKARFIAISFNSEGFISFEKMSNLLEKFGTVTIIKSNYNTFRGSRNLSGRNKHVTEYIYLLEKKY
jgi:adenine-specific DNA-methyltransferase